MDYAQLIDLIGQIKGCTFASLDAECKPKPGVREVITNERVILFTNKKSSGYENMVKRRLEEVGKDPASFSVSLLPWGSRIPNTPLIEHHGKIYLQCIVLKQGTVEYFVGKHRVNPEEFGIKSNTPNQGLTNDKAVRVHTFNIESITRIALLGEEFTGRPLRKTLRPNYG